MHPALDTMSADARPILIVTPESWTQVAAGLSPVGRAFAEAQGFEPRPGRHLVVPDASGAIEAVLFGADPADPFALGKLPAVLPQGIYRLADRPADPTLAALA